MAEFILMNKNTEIMVIKQNELSLKFEDIYEVFYSEYAPFSVFQSMKKEKDEIVKELNAWFQLRVIPDYRDNKEELMRGLGVESSEELANKHYALSLSDQYWLKPMGSNITWNNVNYFHNEYDSKEFFNVTYGEGSFRFLSIYGVRSDRFKSPNNTLTGQLKKTWVKINGESYLFKGSCTLHNFEPINEVIASKICEILDVPYVKYDLKHLHSKRQDALVSVCKCMINDTQEIVPAYELIYELDKVTETPEDYYLYLDLLKKHDVPFAEEHLQKMFMLDYIMLNEDRHMGNFGIIRNVDTLEWESVCPVFDTGRSNNSNVSEMYWNFEEGEVKCFTKEFVSSEILPKFFTVSLSVEQINELKDMAKEFAILLKRNQSYVKLFDEQIDRLGRGFEFRIQKFCEIMRQKGLVMCNVNEEIQKCDELFLKKSMERIEKFKNTKIDPER